MLAPGRENVIKQILWHLHVCIVKLLYSNFVNNSNSAAKRLKTTPSKPKAFSMAEKGVVRIDDASANYFRLRRAGLLPGTQYESIEEAVTAACGLQAQEFSSAMLALSLRVRDSTLLSTQTKAEELFFGLHPRLVRIYAQRTTIHVYTTTDWPLVASCCITAEWKDSETKCDAEIADKCEKCLRESGINGATKNEITEKAIATSSKDLGVKVNATDWEQNPFRQCAAHALQYMCSVGRGVLDNQGQERNKPIFISHVLVFRILHCLFLHQGRKWPDAICTAMRQQPKKIFADTLELLHPLAKGG